TFGQASTNWYQFTGRENDGTGLYYYRARYYHPTLSRFVSEDPLGFAGGDVDLYAYARNNPVGFRDPTGTFSPITILGGAAGGALTGAAAGALVGGVSGFITSVAEGQPLGQAIQSGKLSLLARARSSTPSCTGFGPSYRKSVWAALTVFVPRR